MKMLKKLLAIVLTGAMALTLLTACGSNAVNADKLEGEPADIRYIGTALDTLTIYGKQTTVRIIVVTAPVKGQESQNHGKA